MSRGVDMDSVVANSRNEQFRITDVVSIFRPSSTRGWTTLRLFGPVYANATFWVKTKRGDGAKVFNQQCRCFDPETCQVVSDKYDPWYDEYRRELDENIDSKDRLIQYSQYFYMQAILRKEQNNEPRKNRMTEEEKETGIKEVHSDSWTPVVVVQLTRNVFKKIQEMKEDNIVKLKSGTKKAYNVNDVKYGRDIMIKYDDSTGVAIGDRYQVKLVVDEGRTPLTEAEQNYLKFDLDKIYPPEESDSDVKRNFMSWAKHVGLEELHSSDDSEDDDKDDEELESPKRKSKKLAKSKPVDDEDDFDDDSEDDEEVSHPKLKKSKSKKSKSDDEDDDFDDESDDEEEDEKPSKKVKSKKSKSDDEEDDFDDDESDDDFDEDEKPKSKKKSKTVDEDEDEEDDFDEDEDEEEEKPKKPSKKSKVKSKTKSKPKKSDDDDFDDDDDDDEEDF